MKRTTKGAITTLAVVATLASIPRAQAVPTVDLTANGSASGTIGDVIFKRDNAQPTGTGVFDPFLTIDSPGNNVREQGYNTSTSNQLLPLDDLRNHWNKNLQKKDLAVVNGYYIFVLDSNETGNGNQNRYLSIDNIRIYTSPTGSQTTNNPDELGTLRYALNDPLSLSNNPNWVKIDSTRNTPLQKTSGSGSSDMTVMIPTHYLDGAADTDFVYFYNLNGAQIGSDNDTSSVIGTGAEAGFEEWAALTGPAAVPDGGSTLVLLGSALASLGALAGRRKTAINA